MYNTVIIQVSFFFEKYKFNSVGGKVGRLFIYKYLNQYNVMWSHYKFLFLKYTNIKAGKLTDVLAFTEADIQSAGNTVTSVTCVTC